MPKFFFLIFSVSLLMLSCKKDEKVTIPSCLLQYVNNANYSVYEYSYNEEIYFVVEHKNLNQMPDAGVDVYTANCQQAGYLGGLNGNTQINGVEFSNYKLVRKL